MVKNEWKVSPDSITTWNKEYPDIDGFAVIDMDDNGMFDMEMIFGPRPDPHHVEMGKINDFVLATRIMDLYAEEVRKED